MKPSARVATLFIFLFFLLFNAVQIYLVIERIAEAKTKFNTACSSSLLFALSEYHKMKAMDSASTPNYAWIAYSRKNIEVNRLDTQSLTLTAPASLLIDTVPQAFIETTVNTPRFRSIDLDLFDSLFQKALHARKIHSAYHLDTIPVPGGRRLERQLLLSKWDEKKRKDHPYITNPLRLPYNSNIFIFAGLKKDPAFFRNDLLWPLLAFALILLISNTALVFVYKTIRKQKRINELKTDFINNITHEMKTPITIASAGLEALELQIPHADHTGFYLQTSKKQLRLLNEFVERILESAVRDVSDFNLRKEKIDLHALFGEVIPSYSLLQGKKASFRLTGQGPVFISGDRLHLETAFHNIIDNAIKYSHGSVDIHIDLVENSRDCTIKIADNGMGIPPQFVRNIFDKFFRVPQGDAQSVKGFGLGLYYVSSIVKKHAGNITVHSKWQSGTEFIITLPKHP